MRSSAGAFAGKKGCAHATATYDALGSMRTHAMAFMNPRLILLALWTCLAGILPVSAQQSETRVALLIGNAAYPDAEAPLRDPVNNVRSLADELRRTGFDVDIGENLTKEAMRAAIDRF